MRDDDIMCIGSSSRFSIRALAFEMRHKAKALFQNQIKDAQSRVVVVAFVLGIKDYLDQELKSAYATSGTMYVLALSGLHMGIIFLILVFFETLKKYIFRSLLLWYRDHLGTLALFFYNWSRSLSNSCGYHVFYREFE